MRPIRAWCSMMPPRSGRLRARATGLRGFRNGWRFLIWTREASHCVATDIRHRHRIWVPPCEHEVAVRIGIECEHGLIRVVGNDHHCSGQNLAGTAIVVQDFQAIRLYERSPHFGQPRLEPFGRQRCAQLLWMRRRRHECIDLNQNLPGELLEIYVHRTTLACILVRSKPCSTV